jgi:hypothetical protein
MKNEIKARILKDFDVTAPLEMIEAVDPEAFIHIAEGEEKIATQLGALPKQFTIDADDLTLIHILWLRRKHPDLVMGYNRKTKLVAIDLGESK